MIKHNVFDRGKGSRRKEESQGGGKKGLFKLPGKREEKGSAGENTLRPGEIEPAVTRVHWGKLEEEKITGR